MPAVKISARLERDENISFLDGHYLISECYKESELIRRPLRVGRAVQTSGRVRAGYLNFTVVGRQGRMRLHAEAGRH